MDAFSGTNIFRINFQRNFRNINIYFETKILCSKFCSELNRCKTLRNECEADFKFKLPF